ncbi:cysteine protease ATG4B isoform X7 [Anoplolepis gracilipes]|uniref:cysteine protease ATG4B isoform X7 n=1 Tax=Anoplolepis gracilipes TaxID=354296 RepID=UPI003B9EB0A4
MFLAVVKLLTVRTVIMDSLFTQNVLDEAEDIPQTDEPIWILGRKYNALKELDMIRRDIRSMLWFTYRKGFIPIGGCNSTFTSDKGWGCMLRCGQMVLAQALITLHLGKDWQWIPETRNNTYLKILSRFEDKRAAAFSIHQIALMGASEGKEVGQWFGPNTIAQVLKKLVIYDEWSSITIHVALDNTIIINDIRDEVIYLDPHTTQKSGSIEDKMNEEEIEMDTTYHCKSASRIPITGMDPSVALCFFCATEKEFKSLCKSIQEELILPEKQPLFELCRERLTNWSPANDVASEAIAAASSSLKGYIKTNFGVLYNNNLNKKIGCGSITDGCFKLEVHIMDFDEEAYNLMKGDKIKIIGEMQSNVDPSYFIVQGLKDIIKLEGRMSLTSIINVNKTLKKKREESPEQEV